MTNITTINGYNAKGEIVTTVKVAYETRYSEVNRIMNMEEVTHVTTSTTIIQDAKP